MQRSANIHTKKKRKKFRRKVKRETKHTEISNPGMSLFNFVSDTKNGRNLDQRGRHHLTVNHRLSQVPRSLSPHDPPRRRSLRGRPSASSGRRHSEHSQAKCAKKKMSRMEKGEWRQWQGWGNPRLRVWSLLSYFQAKETRESYSYLLTIAACGHCTTLLHTYIHHKDHFLFTLLLLLLILIDN